MHRFNLQLNLLHLPEVVAEVVAEEVAVDKMNMECPLCEKKLYSSIGDGCVMCGMPVENEAGFCSDECKEIYKKINLEEKKK